MSNGLSDAGENAFLRGSLRASGGLPAVVYLALTSTPNISESMTMASLTEPSGSAGYARKALNTKSDTDWPTIGQAFVESKQVMWTASGGSWAGIQHVVLCGSVSGDGPIYAYRNISGAPVSITDGQTIVSSFKFSLE